MRELAELKNERDMAAIMVELTSAFEGIASTRISQIKDQAQRSALFFDDLWQIYSQIRVDDLFHFGRRGASDKVIQKELLLLITSEGSFSGDIDQRLVEEALKAYKPEVNDIVVVGHHGVAQLSQHGVSVAKSFRMPTNDKNFNVQPLIAEVQRYAEAVVFYESYVSLMVQNVKSLKLGQAVTERGASVKVAGEIISESNYIFEPSTFAVVDHLESSMMQITLSEVILESKLAQYASRFRAMRFSHEKADESLTDLNWQYSRARRHVKDERLKEVINGLRRRGDA